MNELKYFGMDEYKSKFVIFELDREDMVNIYIWVNLLKKDGDRVSLYPVSRLFSYKDHVASPYWVKEDGVEDKIAEALEIVVQENLTEKLEEFEKLYNNEDGRFDKWYEELDEAEEAMHKAIEGAKAESGYWPWTPEDD